MNSKEALKTLGNVEVAVTTIRSGRTHFKTLKQQYETEFEVLERELLIKKELKDFDVYQRQLEQLEKENRELKEHSTELFDRCALLTLKVEGLKKENQELKEQVDYYKKEMESEQYFRESNQNHLMNYVQAINILKDFFIIHQKNSNYLITATGFDRLSQMDYELLKEVFESVGDSDE